MVALETETREHEYEVGKEKCWRIMGRIGGETIGDIFNQNTLEESMKFSIFKNLYRVLGGKLQIQQKHTE